MNVGLSARPGVFQHARADASGGGKRLVQHGEHAVLVVRIAVDHVDAAADQLARDHDFGTECGERRDPGGQSAWAAGGVAHWLFLVPATEDH